MAAWPTYSELHQVLNVENEEDWDDYAGRWMSAAIARVKRDVGVWDEDTDEPDDSLAAAALRMAELMATRPSAPVDQLANDATYRTHLHGHRKRFAIA